MAESMVVSVVLLAHNAQSYIRRAVESLQNQSVGALEIICVDAGSSDSTQDQLQALASRDMRIKVFHIDSANPLVALHFGLAQARGTYVVIVEGECWANPLLLEDMTRQALILEELEASEASLIIAGTGSVAPPALCFLGTDDVRSCFQILADIGILFTPAAKLFKRELLYSLAAQMLEENNQESLHILVARYILETQALATVPRVLYRTSRPYMRPFSSLEQARRYFDGLGLEYELLQTQFVQLGAMPELLAQRYAEQVVLLMRTLSDKRSQLSAQEKRELLHYISKDERFMSALSRAGSSSSQLRLISQARRSVASLLLATHVMDIMARTRSSRPDVALL